jgi:hypothetical protein
MSARREAARWLAPVLLLVLFASMAIARPPTIEFDVAGTIAVQQLEHGDESLAGSQEKLIAIRLRVSTLLSPQAESRVEQLVVSLESPSGNFQVVDFLPKTTLGTRLDGPIAVKTAAERNAAVDFDATGLYKCITGASLIGKFSDAHSLHAEFRLLPPKEVVAAAGTIQRGRGVYFKLRPSSQETLEGAKEYFVVARVPAAWRGDVARIRCSAELGRSVQQDFLIALHLAGDTEAQARAEQFSAAERELRRVAATQRKRIEHEASPKLLQKIGIADPAISPQWLSDWLYGQTRPDVAGRLPKPVRTAALQYSTARTELHELAGESRVVARARIED